MIRLTPLVFTVFLLASLSPATLAGTTYLSDGPVLSASLAGQADFLPGETAVCTIALSNTASTDGKIIQQRLSSPDDSPGTAKLVTVALGSGEAPVDVRSDPQMVGDLLPGSTVKVPFTIQVAADAPPGEYLLPVSLRYSVVTLAEQFGSDTVAYQYADGDTIVDLPVLIKPALSLSVVNVTTEHLDAGNDGYVTVFLENAGYERGTGSVARLSAVPGTPVSPVDNAVFIGEFPHNATVPCRYMVTAAPGAGAGVYPLAVLVEYKNSEGDTVRSDPVTFGVAVGGKADFSLSSIDTSLYPGDTRTIQVEFRNTGEAPVYGAQARISPSSPFTAPDAISALGDLPPGGNATATFTIAVDKGATPKDYALNAEVRFRDGLGTMHTSDPIEVRLEVVPRTGVDAVLNNPVILTVIVALVIGIGYLGYRRRAK